MAEVGILIVDDDLASQRALRNILDSEGWMVRGSCRRPPKPSRSWATGYIERILPSLFNVALAEVNGPLFAILRDLTEADAAAPPAEGETAPKRLRALFLVCHRAAPATRRRSLSAPGCLILSSLTTCTISSRKSASFWWKPARLRSRSAALVALRRANGAARSWAFSRDVRRNTMFSARDDYQMTDEDMAEFERQEEEDRKRREREIREMKDRGRAS